MKSLILIVVFSLSVLFANACRCMQLSLEDEWKNAELIFTGVPFKKTEADKVTYYFLVQKTFKGNITDTVMLQTGFGHGDCGSSFTMGTVYLIYANDGRTNTCRRNAQAINHPDLPRLQSLYEENIKNGWGLHNNPELSIEEAGYFNNKLKDTRQSFDFSGKKIAFLYSNDLLDKQDYFLKFVGQDVAHQLVVFNDREKKLSNGYDAVVVCWKKSTLSKKQKRKLVKRLAKVEAIEK